MPETRGRSLENIQSEFRRPVLGVFRHLRIPGGPRAPADQGQAGQEDDPVELAARPQETAAASSSGTAA